MKAKKTFSDWLSNRYILVVRNEENFAEKTSFSFTYAKIIVFITTTSIFLFSLCFYLSSTILAKWFHPAGREMVINKQIIELTAQVDSLEEQIAYRDKALLGISQVIQGNDKFLGAQNSRTDTTAIKQTEVNTDTIAPVDIEIRKEMESQESMPSNPVVRNVSHTPSDELQNIFLFNPLTGGIITDRFDAKKAHYGVDIVAKKDEPVKAVADGTVIMASWTSDTGHIMAVQHHGNLISVYKHNSVLLKKTGNFVRAGEIISVIGNSGELTSGPHLHFELWHNSNPINPEIFVSF
ncbi:M23 family metallopeptidase [Rhodocytophaga rosea]|uniref:M23 family metallopeptidase n=1 Tax=Rhodocytophaga rosea TaxID=2704465 RepID=A0A6C0GMG7_9BACT|nr:M23 family metallopeptidase [Rhodocytophaga rosea]QHT69024.1 M23 family metallopeptidase [Rhodocytophaga rosea]